MCDYVMAEKGQTRKVSTVTTTYNAANLGEKLKLKNRQCRGLGRGPGSLRVLVVLAGDLNPVPSTHRLIHNHQSSSFRRPETSSDLCGHRVTWSTYILTYRQNTHTRRIWGERTVRDPQDGSVGKGICHKA